MTSVIRRMYNCHRDGADANLVTRHGDQIAGGFLMVTVIISSSYTDLHDEARPVTLNKYGYI